MGRLYSVKGWIEPAEDNGDDLMQIIKSVVATPEYMGFAKNWTLTKAFGYSEFVFFGATAKYADSIVEDVVNQIVSSGMQFDGYFECVDEEEENSWSMRITDSNVVKSALPLTS